MPIRLALSLHAPEDALRSQIMPINERYPIAEVLDACEAYYERRRRKVFVEYVMLAGVNDTYGQAVQLAGLLDPRIYKVNLIPYNPTGSVYDGSSRGAIDAFKAVLEEHGLRATVRLTRGRDIDAACGQLAAQGRRPADASEASGSAAARWSLPASSRARSSRSRSARLVLGRGPTARARGAPRSSAGRTASGTAASCGRARRRTASGRPPRSGRARPAPRSPTPRRRRGCGPSGRETGCR